MDLARCPDVPSHVAVALEQDAARYWDLFYQRNDDKFFKDRHWLAREFPVLLTAPSIVEVGCGVGNTLFPLAKLNSSARIHGFDFAPSAIDVVRRHPGYGGRITAHVADLTMACLQPHVPAQSIAVATMFFVLSALSPEAMPQALQNLKASLAPGGRVCVRDYARGDLAQERLAGGGGKTQRLGQEGFYVRGDGTRAYYFTLAFLRQLFEEAGFVTEQVSYEARSVENRKKEMTMERRFVQGIFCLPPDAAAEKQPGGHTATDAGPPMIQGSLRLPRQPLYDRTIQSQTDGHTRALHPEQGRGTATRHGLVWAAAEGPALEPALALARIVEERLATELAAKVVMEWGAAVGSGLAAMVALRWCRRAIAVAAGVSGLQTLRGNVRRNAHRVIVERLRLHCVELDGDVRIQEAQMESAKSALPRGVDVLLLAIARDGDQAGIKAFLQAGIAKPGATVWLSMMPGMRDEVVDMVSSIPGLEPENIGDTAEEGILCYRVRP